MKAEMTTLPLVSVVVTTRNRLDWLKQCANSVQTQRNVSWELIVIDDASNDLTWAWLCESAGERLQVHRFKERRERCAARNQGLSMAKGLYVMFLDDDDWLWPDALYLLATALDENPDAAAATGARWAVFTAENYERRDAHPRRLQKRNILDELLFGWSAVSGQNLYLTSVVREIGGYDESIIPCEDRLLWLRVAMQGDVVLIPNVVMSYRYHDSQVRPENIRKIRNQVARRAIASLPKERRRKALQLRLSGHWIEKSEEEMSDGSPLTAAGLVGRAMFSTPGIFTSSLIGEWVFRRLTGRLYRRFFPALKNSTIK